MSGGTEMRVTGDGLFQLADMGRFHASQVAAYTPETANGPEWLPTTAASAAVEEAVRQASQQCAVRLWGTAAKLAATAHAYHAADSSGAAAVGRAL